jgi:hypothetical protein
LLVYIYVHKEVANIITFCTLLDSMAVWVTTTGCQVPDGAIRAGYEADGRPLFIARAYIEGILTPGKCGFHLQGAYIPSGCIERVVKEYEVLVHPTNATGFFDWKCASNGRVPEGAYETDKELYVGRAYYSGSLVPCKIAKGQPHWCAYVGHHGGEHTLKDYEVLCKFR